MAITLKKATREDIETIWKMQVEAFTELLDKYQDFDMSPATESLEKIIAKFEQPWTTYYYIVENDIVVGAVRIVNKNDGSRKRISPIWIMGEFRNKGYAQQAMIELENIYGSDHWCLDTILQEKGNLHLYEKMGYVQTGKVEHINEKMDIVFYEKNGRRNQTDNFQFDEEVLYMKKSISRIIGVIMLFVAIVFTVFALNHPEKSFPWNNTITWLLHGIYFLVTVVLLIAPKMKK